MLSTSADVALGLCVSCIRNVVYLLNRVAYPCRMLPGSPRHLNLSKQIIAILQSHPDGR